MLQRDHLKSEHKLESLVSRESSFLFNNLVLLAACFTILWGTLFPVISEYVQGNKVTVGAPFYNRVAVPIGLFLLFLTGIGPLLAWRSSSFKSIRRNFVLPVASLASSLRSSLIAVRRAPLGRSGPRSTRWSAFSLARWCRHRHLFGVSARRQRHSHGTPGRTSSPRWSSSRAATPAATADTSSTSAWWSSLLGSPARPSTSSYEKEMGIGQSINIGPYRSSARASPRTRTPTTTPSIALLDVYRGDKKITQLAPEKRFYRPPSNRRPWSRTTPLWPGTCTSSMQGKNPDTGLPIIKVFLNPLMAWIWIGVGIVVFGTESRWCRI